MKIKHNICRILMFYHRGDYSRLFKSIKSTSSFIGTHKSPQSPIYVIHKKSFYFMCVRFIKCTNVVTLRINPVQHDILAPETNDRIPLLIPFKQNAKVSHVFHGSREVKPQSSACVCNGHQLTLSH